MTDDQQGQGRPPGGSRWDPLPQGDYDDGATAFVNLPEGGIDALLDAMESPLAAPGHGYVPPQITVDPAATAGTDPAAPGTWGVPGAPVDGAQWHDPATGGTQGDRFTYNPGATGQWAFEERSPQNPAPGQDVTGQWSIPVADGDLPDESGEFTQSSLVEQWGGTPPPTLPGGAAAPWAPPQDIGRPWGPGVPGVPQEGDEHGPVRDERAHDENPAPRQPRDTGTYGGRPLPHADGHAEAPYGGTPAQGTPVPPAEQAPRQDVLGGTPAQGTPLPPAGHAPGQDVFGGTPAHGTPMGEHASGQHDGPRSAGVPQPLPADSYPGQPQWPAGAESAEGAPDGLREHPRPGGQDAPEPASGAADAQQGPEAADRLSEPSDASDAEPVTEPADAPDAATEPGTSDTPADQGGPAPDAPHEPPHDDHPLASYVLRVNGTDRPVTDAWIGESLLYVLRERLGLAGAKDGCSQGECGACNVQVDGRLVASCLVPAVTAAGTEVRTVEGLAQDGRPSDVQRALARCGAVQCGFCVPGMAMTVHDLLEGNPAPTDLETRQALCGNLCRCSGYRGVVDAVREVVAEREAHAAEDDGDGDADTPRIPHQAGPGAGGVNPSAFGVTGPVGEPHDQPYGTDGGQA
ncbi:2Fe-2S iron-sulfur cluster-binding protein [Streptomyces sp. NPDC087226]|uniref:2Fe-2S iron-sulfur cluster-binding protein n=1 Tax=Streptomyces sp. NPDC087226 TaxID=3365771 RepID=UPI0038099CF0